VQLTPQCFDLAALIDEVVSLSSRPAAEAGLLISARLQMPRPCFVMGDPARVRQILHNLVGNAIKFTEQGSVTVMAQHNAEHGRARIRVCDTGVGIPPADQALIFQAFHQADGSFTRRYAGTGLGLTIARELAQAMGGDLTVKSQVGKGSCFTVKLDLPRADAPQVEAAAAAPAPLPDRLQGHVLLAEDNPVNAIVAEAVLVKHGLAVTVVADGQQALDAFCRQRPDLVLLDCQMPVMDGLEAARRMRAHEAVAGWSRTPMIALTANAFAGDREDSLAAGMDDHLSKPFRDDDLVRLLARHLPSPGPASPSAAAPD
jgi:CheY-like chemotaxis protein/anti-sigma regulatory factor (Ser/Thr protein kinase)